MKSTTKKFQFNPEKGFDDSELNNTGKQISRERSLEIEKLMQPKLDEMFQKLKQQLANVKGRSEQTVN